jgi:hypothetical protein
MLASAQFLLARNTDGNNPLNVSLDMMSCGIQYCNANPGIMGGPATSSGNFALINQPFSFNLTTGQALTWSQSGEYYYATFGQGGSFQMSGPNGLTFTGVVTGGYAAGVGPGWYVRVSYVGQWSNGDYGEGATDVTFEEFGASYATLSDSTAGVLHSFTNGLDGARPIGGLTIDQAGNLYGTTIDGGCGHGNVFKMTRRNGAWLFDPLYCFTAGIDGSQPVAGVVIGSNGTLYGTTQAGGGNGCANGAGCGTVFNVRPPATPCQSAICLWNEHVLYRFTGGADGAVPESNVIFDQAGNIYGTTVVGGGQCNGGVVFELTPSPVERGRKASYTASTVGRTAVYLGVAWSSITRAISTARLPASVPITPAPFLN